MADAECTTDIGRMPEDVRLMILSHLDFRTKLRAMLVCRGLNNVVRGDNFWKSAQTARSTYTEALEQRSAQDTEEVHGFFWGVVKLILTALLSLVLLGGLGLYCLYYGTIYEGRPCDYPLADVMRTYGKIALMMWGGLLLMQCVVQHQTIINMVPRCFKRSRNQEFFDFESGEVIQEPDYSYNIDWAQPRARIILFVLIGMYVLFVWFVALVGLWNLIHIYYYVIYSEDCDAELYDAAWFFAMLPLYLYGFICILQSCIFGFIF